MINHDTIELLRECDAGIQTGIAAIDEVKDRARDGEFKNALNGYRREYAQLQDEMQGVLHEYGDEGKDPNPLAKGMAKIKTDMAIAVNGSDQTIADLITDGCNMGIKSLYKYMNRYKGADGRAKDFARRLTELQNRQLEGMRKYL